MSGRSRLEKPARGTPFATALLALAAILFCVDPASAQLFQWTPEQLIEYTGKNPALPLPRRAPGRCPMRCWKD